MAFLIVEATVEQIGPHLVDAGTGYEALACAFEYEDGELCENDIHVDQSFYVVGMGEGVTRIWCLNHVPEGAF